MRFAHFCTTSIITVLALTQSTGAVAATNLTRLQFKQEDAANPFVYTQIAAKTDVSQNLQTLSQEPN